MCSSDLCARAGSGVAGRIGISSGWLTDFPQTVGRQHMFGKRKGPSAEGLSMSITSMQYEPYTKSSVNQIYNLLFCDALTAFKPSPGQSPTHWQSILFSGSASEEAIRSLADDANAESRIRALAYNLLRAHGKAVPTRQLLGVIVEVPFENGLDVLAAYPDGGVRDRKSTRLNSSHT